MSFCTMAPQAIQRQNQTYGEQDAIWYKEQADALAHMLTYAGVERLRQEGALSEELAREWVALLQAHGHTAPFNLIALRTAGV